MASPSARVFLALVLLATSASCILAQNLRLQPGAVQDVPDWQTTVPNILEIATFALKEHNQKNGLTEESGSSLSLEKIVSVKRQVVSGLIYYITLQVKEGSEHKLYEVKVWVKAWMNFMSLQDIKFLKNIAVSADFGTFSRDSLDSSQADKSELKEALSDDPEVQLIVKKAVELLQQQSNSLSPYEVVEVSSVRNQVLELNGQTSYELLLKLKRGSALENLKVEIHKNDAGRWFLKQALFY